MTIVPARVIVHGCLSGTAYAVRRRAAGSWRSGASLDPKSYAADKAAIVAGTARRRLPRLDADDRSRRRRAEFFPPRPSRGRRSSNIPLSELYGLLVAHHRLNNRRAAGVSVPKK